MKLEKKAHMSVKYQYFFAQAFSENISANKMCIN